MGAVEDFVKGDDLARVGGHAAHGGDQAGFGAALGFVVGLVVANRRDQIPPLVSVGILLVLGNFGFPLTSSSELAPE